MPGFAWEKRRHLSRAHPNWLDIPNWLFHEVVFGKKPVGSWNGCRIVLWKSVWFLGGEFFVGVFVEGEFEIYQEF